MSASDYTETNTLNIFKGITFPIPAGCYVALHTTLPVEPNNVVTEVSTANWPAYVRVDAALGGAISSGWSAVAENAPVKQIKNAKSLAYPANNGAGSITVSHWSVWDAATSGNMLNSGALATPAVIGVGIIFVFDINALTITMD